MSYLANRIAHSIPFDFHQHMHHNKEETKMSIVDRKTKIKINGIDLVIRINSTDYDDAYEKTYLRQPNIIDKQDSIEWI